MEQKPNDIIVTVPPALFFLNDPFSYKVVCSGRGAGKSWSFARTLIVKALDENALILCCREVQASIKDSVYRLLVRQINLLGLQKFFTISNNSIKCGKTGSEFIFKGMKDERSAESVRSIEGIKYCWVEEAHTLSQNSLDLLIPTIRDAGSEIWFSLNARFEEDAVWKMFFGDQPLPPDTMAREVTWRDNPHFTDELRKKMEQDKRVSEPRYQHVWEGKLQKSYGNIIKRAWLQRWDPGNKPAYKVMFLSADTAFSKKTTADYSVIQLWGITDDFKHLDLLDVKLGRWGYPELLRNMTDFIDQFAHETGGATLGATVVEAKGSGQSLIQSLESRGYGTIAYDPGSMDKTTRLNNAAPFIEDGSVRIPPDEHAVWVEAFIAECVGFRSDLSHPFDDQVDAMTQAVYTWDRT